MRPPAWSPPVELSPAEQPIVKRIRRAKLFVFLRERRHELFDAAFQEELAAPYASSGQGRLPVPPARLALATVLQAYVGCSDDEVVEATAMDRRWQLVLDCLDCAEPPFSKGTLVAFRRRLIEHGLDRRLVERTVALAAERGGFGSRALRAALDSSPLWGAGRVEDTDNLLGHAVRKALGVLARRQGRGLADVATEAGAPILGGTSLKAALDLDWDDPAERTRALVAVLDALGAVERYVDEAGEVAEATPPAFEAARQVREQDVERAPDLDRGRRDAARAQEPQPPRRRLQAPRPAGPRRRPDPRRRRHAGQRPGGVGHRGDRRRPRPPGGPTR